MVKKLLNLPKELLSRIKDLAWENRLTVNEYIRKILVEHVSNEGK